MALVKDTTGKDRIVSSSAKPTATSSALQAALVDAVSTMVKQAPDDIKKRAIGPVTKVEPKFGFGTINTVQPVYSDTMQDQYNSVDKFKVSTIDQNVYSTFQAASDAAKAATTRPAGMPDSEYEKYAAQKLEEQKQIGYQGQDVETYKIVDGNDLPHLDKSVNMMVVGRDRLTDVNSTDQVVMYDKYYGKFYRYDDDAKAVEMQDKVSKSAEHLQTVNNYAQSYLSSYKNIIDGYQTEIKKAMDAKNISMVDELTKKYTDAVDRYNKATEEMQGIVKPAYEAYVKDDETYKQYGKLGMNPEFKAQLQKYSNSYDAKIKELEKNTAAIGAQQDTAASDAMLALIHSVLTPVYYAIDKTDGQSLKEFYAQESAKGLYGYSGNPLDTAKEVVRMHIAPIKMMVDGDLAPGTAIAITAQNWLQGLAKDMDFFTPAQLVKSIVRSVQDGSIQPLYDMYRVPGAATVDQNGKYVSGNVDYNTGNKLADFALEVVSDPTMFLGTAGKGIAKAAIKDDLLKAFKELAPEASVKELKSAAKVSTNITFKNGTVDLANMFNKGAVRLLGEDAVKNLPDALRLSGEFATKYDLSKALSIAGTLHSVGEASDVLQRATMTFNTLGANKALGAIASPLAKRMLEAASTAGSSILPKASSALKYFYNTVYRLFNGTNVPLHKVAETYETMQKTYTGILDILHIDGLKETENAMKQSYLSAVTRTELGDLIVTIKNIRANNLTDEDIFKVLDEFATTRTKGEYTKFIDLEDIPNSYYGKVMSQLSAEPLAKDLNTIMYNVQESVNKIVFDKHVGYADMSKYRANLKAFSDAHKEVTTLMKHFDGTPETALAIDAGFTHAMNNLYAFKNSVLHLPEFVTTRKLQKATEDLHNSLVADYNNIFKAQTLDTTKFAPSHETKLAFDRFKYHIKNYDAKAFQFNQYRSWVSGDYSAKAMIPHTPTELTKSETIRGEEVFNEIYKALKEKNDGVSADVLKERVFKLNAEDDATGHYVKFIMSNAAESLEYATNPTLKEATSEVIDLIMHGDIEVGYNRAIDNAYAFNNQIKLLDSIYSIPEETLSGELKMGLIDALTYSNADKFAKKLSNTLALHDIVKFDKITDDITQSIIDSAERYYNGTHNSNLRWIDEGVGRKYTVNAVDTATNMDTLLDMLDHGILKDAKTDLHNIDNTTDVYYTLSRTNYKADPYAITFHTADGTRTFINKDVEFVMDTRHATAFHGVSVGKVQKDYETFVKSHSGDTYSNDRYMDEIRKYLEEVMAKNNEVEGKHIRMIGFNTGRTGTGQQDALSNFLYNNAMRTYVGEFVDAADYVRDMQGIKYFSDEAHQALKTAVKEVMYDISRDTIIHPTLRPNIVPKFDARVLRSFNELRVYKAGTEESTLMLMGDGASVAATLQKYENTLLTLQENLTVKNLCLSDYAVDVDELNNYLETITGSKERANLSSILYKSLAKNGAIPVNIKDIVNDKILGEYFDVQELKHMLGFYGKKQEDVFPYVKALNSKTDISNLTLLNHAYTRTDLRQIFDTYRRLVGENYLELELADAIMRHASNLDMAHLYAVVSDTYERLSADSAWLERYNAHKEKLLKATKESAYAELELLKLVENEDKLLYNVGTLFTLDTKIIASKLADKDSSLFEYDTFMQELNKATSVITDMDTRLSIQANIKDVNGLATANSKIFASNLQELLTPVIEFINYATLKSSGFADEYADALANGNTADYITAKMQYSASVNGTIKTLEESADAHAAVTAAMKLSVDAEDIPAFVLRNCYNNLMIDTTANIFAYQPELLAQLKKFLSNAESVGMKIETEGNIIRVYNDLTAATAKDIDALFKLTRSKQFDIDAYVSAMEKYKTPTGKRANTYNFRAIITALQKNLPEGYFLSDFVTTSKDAYETMKLHMPEGAKINTEYMQTMKMFNSGFNMGYIGDYATLGRTANEFMSTNVLSNILSGLNMAAKNLEYVQTHTNFFMNHANSAAAYFAHMNWKDAQAVLKNQDLSLAELTHINGKLGIREHYIASNADLNRIINNPDIAVMDKMVLKEMQKSVLMQNLGEQTSNVNALLKTGAKTLMSMYKVGWLFIAPGAALRNIIDASLKGAAVTENAPAFLRNSIEAPRLIRKYNSIYNAMVDELNMPNALTEPIVKEYFATHDVGMEYDKFIRMFTLHNDDVLKLGITDPIIKNQKFIMRQLEDPNAKALMKDAWKVYKTAYRKTINDDSRILYHNEVLEGLKELNLTDAQYEVLSKMDHLYIPDKNKIVKLITGDNNFIINANKALFQNAENNARLSVALTMMEDQGATMAQALRAIDVSQFDYDTIPKSLALVEKIAPFQTFKIYNMMFWLNYAAEHRSMMRPIISLMRSGDYFTDQDSAETMAFNAIWQSKIANGDVDFTDEDNVGLPFLQQMMNNSQSSIDNYSGMSPYSIKNNGSIQLSDGHVLKIGNSLIDATTYFISLATLPQQIMSGNWNYLLENNLFAPVTTLTKALKYLWDTKDMSDDDKAKEYADFITNNKYDLTDILPLYGAYINMVESGSRNATLSDFTLASILPDGKRAFHSYMSDILDGLATLFPGVIGLAKDTSAKPIGYDWYNQSDEYRATHQYVIGVSYVPAWVKKNPTTYVNSYAHLLRLGYTEDEAHEMLKDGWYVTEDDKLRNSEDYNKLPNQLVFNRDIYDNTLEYLLTSGFTPDEALIAMSKGAIWVDDKGTAYDDIALLSATESSKFFTYWNTLPEYIQYESGQYGKLYAYYKSKGYPADVIKAAIATGAGYIDSNGDFLTLSDQDILAKQQELNTEFESAYSRLPDFIKYTDGAYGRTKDYLEKTKHLTGNDVLQYMITHNAVVDVDGKYHEYSAQEVKAENKKQNDTFLLMFQNLPAHIKYEKGAYSRTLQHLKGLGFSQDEANYYMLNGYYYSVDGKSLNVLNVPYNIKKSTYNKTWIDYTKRKRFQQMNRMAKPESYQRSRQTARRFAPVKKRTPMRVASFTSNIIVDIKKNASRVAINLKSSYPSSYRNIRFGYRKNMYKDQYAKYGMSRMKMRANRKSYSNMAITKLRRKDVQWKMQMQTKRAQLVEDKKYTGRDAN